MKPLAPRRRRHLLPWALGALVVAAACSSNDSSESNTAGEASDGAATDGTATDGTATAGPTTSTGTTAAVDGPSSTTASGDASQGTISATATTSSEATTSAGGNGGTDGPTTGGAGGDGETNSTTTSTTTSTSGGGGGDAVPSPGCTAASPPSSGPFSIDVDGTEREYILRLPDDYDPTRPYPLILAWHGAQYSAEWVDTGGEPQTGPYFGVLEEADGNAIFVAPQALTGSWTNQSGRDVAFADAMVERFEGELCLDESRLFSIGFSMGAIMTMRLGCSRADKFRAIAPLSGKWPDDCPEVDLPIAYFSAHGDVDMTITDDEGMAARDEFASRNGCSDETVELERERCIAFEGCDAGYPVEWCSFSGDHTPAPFAGEAIWEFLSRF